MVSWPQHVVGFPIANPRHAPLLSLTGFLFYKVGGVVLYWILMSNFTAKQKAFIDNYLICLNGTEAARRAKYKGDDNTLGVVAFENLRKPHIKEEIERRWLSEAGVSNEEIRQRFGDGPERRKSKFVYLIEAENGLVKIGISSNVQRRLSTLNTASPVELWILAYAQPPSAAKLEKKLHNTYSDKRVRGEWFRLSHADVAEICSTFNFEIVHKRGRLSSD